MIIRILVIVGMLVEQYKTEQDAQEHLFNSI